MNREQFFKLFGVSITVPTLLSGKKDDTPAIIRKPIAVIYWPENFRVGNSDPAWIYEYMAVLNGEAPANNKWSLTHDYSDYHWFCFYKDDITQPELKVFYEKDFTPIQYEELKQMIMDSLPKKAEQ